MSAILRRAEFKRKRWYRARERRRYRARMTGALVHLFDSIRTPLVPTLACLMRDGSSSTIRWGGGGLHFDVIIAPQCPSPADDYAGHVARGESTSDGTDAAPVHYGEPARAPLSGARE